jgi:peptidoglycan/LPS O-acetylase OafA/YrhL
VGVATKSTVDSLTGLRFLAALSVAVAHGTIVTMRADPDLSPMVDVVSRVASFGMTLFFVLSGFVIHYNYRYSVTQGGFSGFGSFIWARFTRLYPLFFLVLVLDFLFHARENYDPFRLDTQIRALPYYLVMIQSWIYLPIRDHSLIYTIGLAVPVTWSISTEWFFYLVFPAIAPVVLFVRRARTAIVVGLLWCVFWWVAMSVVKINMVPIENWAVDHYGPLASAKIATQDSFQRWLLYFSPYARIGEFILGCIVAQAYLICADRPIGATERKLGLIIQFVAFFAVMFLCFFIYTRNAPLFLTNVRQNFALAPTIAVLIFCSARYSGVLTSFLSSRPLVWLGDVSYEIYLIHFPVFVFVKRASQIYLQPSPAHQYGPYEFLVGLVLLAPVSYLVHRLYDVPVRRWLRNVWQKTSAVRLDISGKQIALAIILLPIVFYFLSQAYVTTQLPELTRKGGISVVTAIESRTCGKEHADFSKPLAKACGGRESCNFDLWSLSPKALPSQCSRTYDVRYQCNGEKEVVAATIPADPAFAGRVAMDCSDATAGQRMAARAVDGGIKVLSATYGGNCQAQSGNATDDLKMQCDGAANCAYRISVSRLKDPAAGCAKDYTYEYKCGHDSATTKGFVKAEAGLGSYATLECPAELTGMASGGD